MSLTTPSCAPTRPRPFIAIALGLALLPLTAHADTDAHPAAAATTPDTTAAQKSMLQEMQNAFQKIADAVEPSVVNIKTSRLRTFDTTDPDTPDDQTPDSKGDKDSKPPAIPLIPRAPRRSEATGSGVIIRPEGYILTNDHVVKGADGGIVTVTLADGREFKGVVYSDFRSDLAVVKIDPGKATLTVAKFADSAAVRPGQWAIAVGSPFDLENTMTVGVISATGRHQEIPGDTPGDSRYYPELIQTDAAINPGNSGGPLFNIDGQVVGINVAIESPVEGSAGVGFAIPSDVAQKIMSQLITSGKVTRGYLGVAPKDLTPALGQEFVQDTGAFVQDVKAKSPAWNGGLRAADIITFYDGKAVAGEVSLRQFIADTAPGKTVKVEYVRSGKPMAADVTIGAVPNSDATPTITAPVKPVVTAVKKPTLGLELRDITAKDRTTQGFTPDVQGAFVVSMDPAGNAEEASVMNGVPLSNTVIQRIGTHTIKNKADVEAALAALQGQSQTTIVFLMNADGEIHQTALTVHF